MSTWWETARDLVFVVVGLTVAFNVRDTADRIHGFAMGTIGISHWFTPTLVRITFGLLGAIFAVETLIGLA
ncbi:hypothetical protein ABZ557_02075 [Streptomyces sp. NPDC019645]|uniref:hypothetical protein n=1 Tax=Streptomyces sp. NPDC019645 TaxID=3154786 RepID=UPI0033E93366